MALIIEAAEVRPGDRVLEVGAGSGYAAGVLSRIAFKVYTIERHAALTEEAEGRFKRLGYDNVELRVGDGTFGWPEAAPFDAILAAAGGPEVPESLKEQLAIGGPHDHTGGPARKITRTSEDAYEEENLGGVAFVPLVGEQGWAEDG